MSTLYAITDSQLLSGPRLTDGVTSALEGGCRLVQYRDKSTNADQRFAEASALLDICNRYDAQLIINDDVELTLSVGAHGVHLGQGDMDPITARQILGKSSVIGVTCHDSLSLAKKAVHDGATYVAFGRFFPSHTKPLASSAPLSLLAEARQELGNTFIVAIGGITLDNAATVLAAGADIVAVSHNLFAAENITARAKKFNSLLLTHY